MRFILDNLDDRVEPHVQLEVLSKMQAIASNLDKLELETLTNVGHVSCIAIDFHDQYDEFSLQYNAEADSSLYRIEVVTPSQAEENDRDFLDDEEQEEYVLGGDYSIYKPLNDMYYYREL